MKLSSEDKALLVPKLIDYLAKKMDVEAGQFDAEFLLDFLGFRGWVEAFAIDENGRLVSSMSRAGTFQQLGGHVGPKRTYTQTIRANFRARAVLWRVHLRATRQAASDNASPFFPGL